MHHDVIQTNGRFSRPHFGARGARAAATLRVARLFDYLFGILYALLGIRFLLEVLKARKDVGFYVLVDRLTEVFYAPFKGIVAPGMVGGVRVPWSLVVATCAYVLLHATIRGLLRLLARS